MSQSTADVIRDLERGKYNREPNKRNKRNEINELNTKKYESFDDKPPFSIETIKKNITERDSFLKMINPDYGKDINNDFIFILSLVLIVLAVIYLIYYILKPSIDGSWIGSDGIHYYISNSWDQLVVKSIINGSIRISNGEIDDNVVYIDDKKGIWDNDDSITFLNGGSMRRFAD